LASTLSQFPTGANLVSWARISPRNISYRPQEPLSQTGKGNRYLKAVLGEAAAAASRTNFLGQRYRRIVKRRGKLNDLVARSIFVIIWHLLADPTTWFVHLGLDFHEQRINNDRRTRDLVRQLQEPGHEVTLNRAA
jgi:hypothetical protein